jgi:hypothetical protein
MTRYCKWCGGLGHTLSPGGLIGEFEPSEIRCGDCRGTGRDSDGTRRAETEGLGGLSPAKHGPLGIAHKMIEEQLHRWEWLLRAGEQARQYNLSTRDGSEPNKTLPTNR